MDDLPPHSTYYNYAYEQENQQTNDNVLEWVLTMTVCLNCELEMLRNLKAFYREREKKKEEKEEEAKTINDLLLTVDAVICSRNFRSKMKLNL